MNLQQIIDDDRLLEIGRKAIEESLVDFRDSRLSVMRNNGLVIRERDGTPSSVVRMGPELALRIGLRAIAESCKELPSDEEPGEINDSV